MYDYNLGRFLSVDPFIQAPGNSQSLNPYSYIMNNPLAGTDPSGYIAKCVLSIHCDSDEPINGRRIISRTQDYAQLSSNGNEQQASVTNNQTEASEIGSQNDSITELPTPKGTGYFGGAGLDGEYVEDMVRALDEVGIKNVFVMDGDGLSVTQQVDVLVGYLALSDKMEGFPHRLKMPDGDAGQFNLIGYSFGSLIAAQFAAKYANLGIDVDNLVLVGSPISDKFLKQLRSNPNIGNVIVKDLTQHGDPIRAGMGTFDAIKAIPALIEQDANGNGSGHFYYRPATQVGQQRRRDLAKELYDEGLR